MSESDYNKLQLGGEVNGDLVIVRADSAEEMDELLKGLSEKADDIITNWSAFKQAGLAKGVFTKSQNSGGSRGRAKDSSPPSSDGGIPKCKHGEMKDLGDPSETKYRHRYYCTEKNRSNQCPAKD